MLRCRPTQQQHRQAEARPVGLVLGQGPMGPNLVTMLTRLRWCLMTMMMWSSSRPACSPMSPNLLPPPHRDLQLPHRDLEVHLFFIYGAVTAFCCSLAQLSLLRHLLDHMSVNSCIMQDAQWLCPGRGYDHILPAHSSTLLCASRTQSHLLSPGKRAF